MRKIKFIFPAIVLCLVACTKTQNSTGRTTNGPPPDDTSTLIKTLTNYNYDQSGNVTDTTVNSCFTMQVAALPNAS